MDSELSFDEHINIKIDTANKIVGIIRRSYRYLNCEILLPLYATYLMILNDVTAHRFYVLYGLIINFPNLPSGRK